MRKPVTHSQSRWRTIALCAVAVVWAGFIFMMSAHTGSQLDSGTGLVGWIKVHLTAAAEALLGPGTDIVSVAAHFLEYAVFGALLAVALFQIRRHLEIRQMAARAREAGLPADTRHLNTAQAYRRLWAVALAAVVLASLYGVTDEFHQSFVPGRMPDPADWLTDTCGAALGAAVVTLVERRHGAQLAEGQVVE